MIKKSALSFIALIIVFGSCFSCSGGNGNDAPDGFPVPGNNGAILATDITSYSLRLTWTKASDDYTTQSMLKYIVYKSRNNNIETYEDANNNGTRVTYDWIQNIDSNFY